MTELTESRRPGEAIMTEGPGQISRAALLIAESQTILANTILGRRAIPDNITATVTARSGNTSGSGDLTLADPAVSAAVKFGRYSVTCIEPATNGGTFRVENPLGIEIGTAKVGVAFDGEIKFTIADATDFVAGDGFDVDIFGTLSAYEYGALDLDATDGFEIASAYAIYPATTGEGESANIAGLVRLCELNGSCLVWPEDITDQQKADAIAQLAAYNIIVR